MPPHSTPPTLISNVPGPLIRILPRHNTTSGPPISILLPHSTIPDPSSSIFPPHSTTPCPPIRESVFCHLALRSTTTGHLINILQLIIVPLNNSTTYNSTCTPGNLIRILPPDSTTSGPPTSILLSQSTTPDPPIRESAFRHLTALKSSDKYLSGQIRCASVT